MRLPAFLLLVLIVFSSLSALAKNFTMRMQANRDTLPIVADTLIVGDIVFEKIEIDTSVTLARWRHLLEIHLVPVIKKAAKKMKPGNYTIDIRFLKERDGSIADIKALNDPGYGLAEGAVKAVKYSSSGWNPAGSDKSKTRSYHTQQITFRIPSRKF